MTNQKPEPLSERQPDVNDAIIWLQEFADESPAESWPERRALVAIAALRELQQRRAAQEPSRAMWADIPADAVNGAAALCESEARKYQGAESPVLQRTAKHWEGVALKLRGLAFAANVAHDMADKPAPAQGQAACVCLIGRWAVDGPTGDNVCLDCGGRVTRKDKAMAKVRRDGNVSPSPQGQALSKGTTLVERLRACAVFADRMNIHPDADDLREAADEIERLTSELQQRRAAQGAPQTCEMCGETVRPEKPEGAPATSRVEPLGATTGQKDAPRFTAENLVRLVAELRDRDTSVYDRDEWTGAAADAIEWLQRCPDKRTEQWRDESRHHDANSIAFANASQRAEQAEAALAVAQQERDVLKQRLESAGAGMEGVCAMLRAERDTLQQSLDEKQRLIQQVEWTNSPLGAFCPWCLFAKRHGHSDLCPTFPPQTSPEPREPA